MKHDYHTLFEEDVREFMNNNDMYADLTGRIIAMTQRLGREVFIRQNSLEREDGEAALRALRVPLLKRS